MTRRAVRVLLTLVGASAFTASSAQAATFDYDVALDPDSASALVGVERSLAFRVTSRGTSASTKATTVTVVIPDSLTVTGVRTVGFNGTPACTQGQTSTCTGVLSSNLATVVVTVMAGANAVPAATGTVSVSNADDQVPTNNTSAFSVAAAFGWDAGVTLSHSGPPTKAGGTERLALAVTNHGSDDLASVNVALGLSGGVELSGASGSGWSCNLSACTFAGRLRPGRTDTVRTTLRFNAPAAPSASVTATITGPDDNPANNVSGVTIPVVPQFTLGVPYPAEVPYRGLVRIPGSIAGPPANPAALQLQPERGNGSSRDFLPLGAVVGISPTGGFSFTDRPTRSTRYRVSGHGVSSRVVTVGVTIGGSLSGRRVRGRSLRVSGSFEPNVPARVSLVRNGSPVRRGVRVRRTGTRFSIVGRRLRKGAYSVRIAPRESSSGLRPYRSGTLRVR